MKAEPWKNYKTWEEAKEVWEKNVKSLTSDWVIFYQEPEEEKDELLGVEELNTKPLNASIKILAAGEKCEKARANDIVVLDMEGFMRQKPIMIEDCLYVAVSDRVIIAYLNK